MPVLDTTFLIDLKRQPELARPILERIIEMEEDIVVPVQAAIEYAAGEVEPAAAFTAIARDFRLRACDEEVGRIAAAIFQAARKARRTPGWADTQIAATAIHEGMFVLTRNGKDIGEALGARVWDYSKTSDPPE